MGYELKLTLNSGDIFFRGGFNNLAQCIAFCKENAEYYKDIEIVYYAYTGQVVTMQLEDAIVTQKGRDSVRRFSK